jgi:23S rRNA (adenine2503-C2)-methyltransferase
MSREDLAVLLGGIGEPAYRARQLYEWIYARRARGFSEMTNIPRALRERLAKSHRLGRLKADRVERSTDGTLKFLYHLEGGRIESVVMPEPGRVTFCISSQVGCALDCSFCLTAQMGFLRHLRAGEIVAQVLNMLEEPEVGERPVNIVFMGMGEPLHNYDAVLRAFRLLADPKGVGIPKRRITLSTAGLVRTPRPRFPSRRGSGSRSST